MKIENAQNLINKKLKHDFTITRIENKVRYGHGNPIEIDLVDALSIDTVVKIKEVIGYRSRKYNAQFIRQGVVIIEFENTKFDLLIDNINNIINFRR